MVQRPKEMIWDAWSFSADVFEFLGLLTLFLLDLSLVWITSMAYVFLCDLSSGDCC